MGGIFITFLVLLLSPAIIFFTIVAFLFAVINLFNYVVTSFGLYQICKNNNYKMPIIAWIPFYNKVILGKIAGKKSLGIISFICDLIFIASKLWYYFAPKVYAGYVYADIEIYFNIFGIISSILTIIIMHLIFKKVYPKLAEILTIVNIFTFQTGGSLALFIMKNNENLINKD